MFKTYPKSRQVIALYDAIPRPGELHLTAYLWGNGQGEKADYERLAKYCPILAKAAEAHRVGDRLQFVNFCWQSEEVKQVWHDNRQEYDLLTQLFGNNALEVKTGRGEYPKPPAREGEAQIKGTLCTLHKRGNESKAVVQPIFPRDYKTDKREYHFRVTRFCNQIVAEADCGELFKLTLPEGELTKFKGRIKKAKNSYLALPQEGGEFVIIHNRHKEGGECLKTLTNGYDKATLYELVTSWSNTPEGKRTQSTNGFGRMFQGVRGDGREKMAKKNGTTLKPLTFQVKSWAKPDSIASILGIALNDKHKGELTTYDHIQPINDLIDAGAIPLLTDEQQRKLNRYLSQFGENSLLELTEKLTRKGVSTSREKMGLEDTEEQLQLLFSGKKLPAGGSYE